MPQTSVELARASKVRTGMFSPEKKATRRLRLVGEGCEPLRVVGSAESVFVQEAFRCGHIQAVEVSRCWMGRRRRWHSSRRAEAGGTGQG